MKIYVKLLKEKHEKHLKKSCSKKNLPKKKLSSEKKSFISNILKIVEDLVLRKSKSNNDKSSKGGF